MGLLKFFVLTVSDRCYKEPKLDKSGPRLVQLIKNSFANAEVITSINPDECAVITATLQEFITKRMHVIITTGGTGLGPRDFTPEATKVVLTKDCPQLSMALTLASLTKTKFAALSRGICGLAGKTLILNFPGSEKAVIEYFETMRDLLPHALQLIGNDLAQVELVHSQFQQKSSGAVRVPHECQHKNAESDSDRNSPFPMISVEAALTIIREKVLPKKKISELLLPLKSPIDIPPFRASIKDGYAMMSSGLPGTKKVLGCIAAGDELIGTEMREDECFKINTGAPVPHAADAIVQIEDTKLLKMKERTMEEDLVEILVQPKANMDIRPIGCDLQKGASLFLAADYSDVTIQSVGASVGQLLSLSSLKPRIAIVSTGSELLSPRQTHESHKIYDSNTTMLRTLLEYFGFTNIDEYTLADDFEQMKAKIRDILLDANIIICSGGVSMGDKDFIKPILSELGFHIHFGRVNMKPGKPTTFATLGNQCFFGLPGNPVSTFVTFHLFALPAIRHWSGCPWEKCSLATIQVLLDINTNPLDNLDQRPEYARASITSRNGCLYASINDNQASSRLQSIVGADVLLHLPSRRDSQLLANSNGIVLASVLRYDFISKYE